MKKLFPLALTAFGAMALLTMVCCAGCGSKDNTSTPPTGVAAPVAGGISSLPPQAQTAEQAQQKADAASHAAHAPH